ncbi:hypothetical protein ACOSP7_006662 [Xanthoceras sorbifolium]
MTRTNPTSNPDQHNYICVDEVVSWARLYLKDYHATNAQVVNSQQLSSRSVKWRPPDASAVKVNSDDAINSSNNLVGFGLVVRDHLGHVLGSSWQKVEASFSPLVAEASALRHGIIFALELGITLSVFE